MKTRPGEKIKLTSIDELLCVPEDAPQSEIEVDKLKSFVNHPFHVTDDEKMDELVNSIRMNGILTPILARKLKDGTFEVVSGHRRVHAAKIAGLATVPAVIREMEDADATIAMVDANLQREELLPSEKAFAYKMRLEAMKERKGGPGRRRREGSEKNSSQNGTNLGSDSQLAKEVGESRNQIHRFIRLTEVIPEILQMIDDKKIPIVTGVEISYLDRATQKNLLEYMNEYGTVKNYQVIALRKEFEDGGTVTPAKLRKILEGVITGEGQVKKITLTETKLRKFFSDIYTVDDMEKILMKLLQQWKDEQAAGEKKGA